MKMIRIGIYTVTYEGIWYNGLHLSIEKIIERAEKFGFHGIEIEGRRPHGFPLHLSSNDRKKIRDYAASKGIEIAAVAANNDFTNPVLDRRESEIVMVSEQIRLASDLGAKIVRVFTDWKGFILDEKGRAAYDIARDRRYQVPSPRLHRWKLCREALKEVTRIAEEYGIVLALQNHPPMIRNYYDLLDMVNEVDSQYLKCCLDAPLLKRQDDDYVARAVLDAGDLIALSHVSGEFEREDGRVVQKPLDLVYRDSPVPRFNYEAFVDTLKQNGYDGYLSFELCHPFLSKSEEAYPTRETRATSHKLASIEEVDQQVRYVHEYLSELIGKR
jgi:sugar phosphate isomerase/epimerase